MKRTLTAVAALAVAGLALPASASTMLIIDDFTTGVPHQVADLPGGANTPPQSDVRLGANILGGSRFMQVESDQKEFASQTSLTASGVTNTLSFNNFDFATGRGLVLYDGRTSGDLITDTSQINRTGLCVALGSCVDLTFGGFGLNEVWFDLPFDFDDGEVYFAAAISDVNESVAVFDEVVTGISSPQIFLNEFFTLELGGTATAFDWSQVGAMAFFISSNWNDGGLFSNPGIVGGSTPKFDGNLSSITVSAIPLPASALLLLGGLGGLAGMSAAKRRRKSA